MNETEKHHAALSGKSADELVAAIQAAGCPTDNAFAEAVWHGLSGNKNRFPGINTETGSEIYQRCGYMPYAGFPLQKATPNLPTREPDRTHYKCGWNDLEYGVNNWTNNPKWKTPLEWAIHCAGIAKEMIPKAVGSHNKAHYQGAIEAAAFYEKTGAIARL